MNPSKEAKSDHEIIKEISNRWSPRVFADREVEVEKLCSLLEAARWAPSSRNEQPWHFIIARKGDIHYPKLEEGLNESNQRWAKGAPVLGVTLARRHFERHSSENKHFMHDMGMAMGNFLIQATAMELLVHQMAGIYPDVIAEYFKIDNQKYEIVAMFALGYYDSNKINQLPEDLQESEKKERERKAISTFVSGNTFGQSPDWLPG